MLNVDPVTLEVVAAALPAITNEMSHVLQRTSYNMMIFEIRDFCCAIVDSEATWCRKTWAASRTSSRTSAW